ncbi:unnamed protein product [Phaeothamnion confervicola]
MAAARLTARAAAPTAVALNGAVAAGAVPLADASTPASAAPATATSASPAGATSADPAVPAPAPATWGIPLNVRVGRTGRWGCSAAYTGIMASERVEIDVSSLLARADAAAGGAAGDKGAARDIHSGFGASSRFAAAMAAADAAHATAAGAAAVAQSGSGPVGAGDVYVVVNGGHTGFFVTQYDDAAWRAAVAAVAGGHCSDVEAVGFVFDHTLSIFALLLSKSATAQARERGRLAHSSFYLFSLPFVFSSLPRAGTHTRAMGRSNLLFLFEPASFMRH